MIASPSEVIAGPPAFLLKLNADPAASSTDNNAVARQIGTAAGVFGLATVITLQDYSQLVKQAGTLALHLSHAAEFAGHAIAFSGTSMSSATEAETEMTAFIERIERVSVGLATEVGKEDGISRLEAFASLPGDWAGLGTRLPDRGTLAAAKALIAQLAAGVPTPHIAPDADGGIGFEWETLSTYVAAEIQSDGLFVWLVKRNGKTITGAEGKWTGRIPEGLRETLQSTFG